MHARIDTLTRSHFWSLLPSSVFDWVVITVSVCDVSNAPKHTVTSHECYLNYSMRHLHRTVLLLLGAHEHCSICRRSTSSEVYCRWGDPSSSHVTHTTIFGVPGWAQLIANGPNHGKYSTLVKTQVCKCVAGQEEVSHMLSYQES